jgi:hypothetical protein
MPANHALALAQLTDLANVGNRGKGIAAKAQGDMLDNLTDMEKACIRLATTHDRNGMEGILAMTTLAIMDQRRKDKATKDRLLNLEDFSTKLVKAMRQANANAKRRLV